MTVTAVSQLMEQLNVATAAPIPSSIENPNRPSPLVLDFIHRGHDGYVPLCREKGGEWQALGNVLATQLRGLFADDVIAAALDADSYFGIHGMYAHGRYRQRHQLEQLQPPLRNLQSVRWINACHVDLDCYKLGMDVHGAMAEVGRMVDAGRLPSPSIYTLGRGLWVFWLLRDREFPNQSLRSFPESVCRRHAKLENVLHTACSTIGSDAAAKSLAQVTRIPGSYHSALKRRVGYHIPLDIHGKPFIYTLDELEDFMSPHMPSLQQRGRVIETRLAKPGPAKPANRKKGLVGHRGRWHRLNAVLMELRHRRRGWKAGHRSKALFYVSMTQRELRSTDKEVRRMMALHLEQMEQPAGDTIGLTQAMGIYNGVMKSYRTPGGPSHQTIADALDVTVAEAAFLSADKSKRPFPPATRFRGEYVPPVPELTRAERTQRRREAVRRIVESLGSKGITPTGAEVQAHLEAEGLGAADATVLADMRAVGCPSRQAHREKPPAQLQPSLPGF